VVGRPPFTEEGEIMSKIEIEFRKTGRVKRVATKVGDAFVRMGIARYRTAHMVAETERSPVIPIPPPAPLSRRGIPPEVRAEAQAAAEKVGGTVVTPESGAAAAAPPASSASEILTPESAPETTPPAEPQAETIDPQAQTSDPPEHRAETRKPRGGRGSRSKVED